MAQNNLVSLVESIAAELEKHKASNISLYKNKQIADWVVVVSSESNRHSKALAEYVAAYLKKNKYKYSMEGFQAGDWVVIDLIDIVLHIFRSEVRDYYQVDELWALSSSTD